MQLTRYKLGDLIVQRREKNEGYDVPIRGVSREGFIKPKQQEADTSIYNVFYRNDFVFNPARMELNSIALNLEFDKALCSSLYEIFYVKDESIVLPEFLNLHIKRDEFARHCEYIGSGSAREYCRVAQISEFDIDLPPIDVQQKIVDANRLLVKRIETNKKLIATLEQTAQTLYRHTFVDNIDPNNLPEGWRMGTLGEFGEVVTGKTPSSECPEDFGNDIPFVTPGDFQIYKKLAIGAERGLSIGGTQKLKTKVIPKKSILVTCIGSDMGKTSITTEDCITNQQINAIKPKDNFTCQYLYYMLRDMEAILKSIALGGSTMPMLSKSSFEVIPVLIPSAETMQQFYQSINAADDMILNKFKENQTLTQMQTLLLFKMGK